MKQPSHNKDDTNDESFGDDTDDEVSFGPTAPDELLPFFFPVFLVRETEAAAAETMPLELVVERAAITNKEKCMLLKRGIDLRRLVGCV